MERKNCKGKREKERKFCSKPWGPEIYIYIYISLKAQGTAIIVSFSISLYEVRFYQNYLMQHACMQSAGPPARPNSNSWNYWIRHYICMRPGISQTNVFGLPRVISIKKKHLHCLHRVWELFWPRCASFFYNHAAYM